VGEADEAEGSVDGVEDVWLVAEPRLPRPRHLRPTTDPAGTRPASAA